MDVPRKDTSKLDAFLENNMTKTAGEPMQTKLVIHNVFKFLNELKERPDILEQINFQKPRELTARICGISVRNVDLIKRECRNGIPIPKKRKVQHCPVTDLNDCDKGNIIKGIVEDFKSKGEYPSVKKIIQMTEQKIPGFKCSNSSMRKVLKMLGFHYSLDRSCHNNRLDFKTSTTIKRGGGKLLKKTDRFLYEVKVTSSETNTDIKKEIVDSDETEEDEDSSESEDDIPLKTIEIERVRSEEREIKEEHFADIAETVKIESEKE